MPTTDIVGMTDSPSTGSTALDDLLLDDDVFPASSAIDAVALSDSPAVATTIFHAVITTDIVSIIDGPSLDSIALDTLVLSDSTTLETTAFHDVTATDIVSILDDQSLDSIAIDILSISEIAAIQSNVFHALAATDIISILDNPLLDSIALDTLLISDSPSVASNIFQAVTAIDVVAIGDAASLFGTAIDMLQLADATSLPTIATTSVIDIVDTVSKVFGLQSINDTIGIIGQITDASVNWNRIFYEPFTLFDCTQFACNYVLHLNESVGLEQALETLPLTIETISISDSIARTATLSRDLGDAISTSERADFMFMPLPPDTPEGIPPLGPVFGTNTDVAEPLPAEPVSGTFTMSSGDPNELADQLGLPAIDITSAISDLSGMTLMLSTYLISLTSSDEFPADEVMMTPKISEVPADMPVFLSINVEETPSASEHAQVQWMELGFTPAVDSTDFALIISPLDARPMDAPEPPADMTALYLNFKWIGDFPPGTDPDDSSYYAEAPTFTFALSEEWADSERVERDENGVPVIALNLLDESEGEWLAVSDVDAPMGAVDGEYVYVAHLEHFSTYVITANESAGGGSAFDRLAVKLEESLGLLDSASNRAVDVIEEFVGERYSANLLDSVVISAKPIVYKTLTVSEDVEVLMTVQDVTQYTMMPPAAKAVLLVIASNTGESPESFTLQFWYNDEKGTRAFESSQEITVEAQESKHVVIDIPFASPGTFDVAVEALSVPQGSLLSTTQIAVTVPWLAVYLYLLLVSAIAILACSVFVLVMYARKRELVVTLGAGTPASKLKVRVKEGAAEAEGGTGLYVGIRVQNAKDGALPAGIHVAIVEFDMLNKSESRQEFVLRYGARGKAGVVTESSQRVNLAPQKSEARMVDLDLARPGKYAVYASVVGTQGRVLGKVKIDISAQ